MNDARHASGWWTALRLAIAALLALLLAALLAPPTPWPMGGQLFHYVDHVGHFWHYQDFAEAVTGGQPLFSSTSVYFPMGADHLLHRGGHLLVLLSWPFLALGGDPALAHNALTVLSLLITACAGALLAARVHASLPAMLVGASGLALSRPLFTQALQGQSEELLLGLVPLFLLALEAAVRRGGGLRLLGAAALGALCLYANLAFGMFLFLILCVALPVLGWGRSRAELGRALSRAGGVAGLALLLAAPLLAVFVAHYIDNLGGVRPMGEAADGAAASFFAIQEHFAVTVPSLWGREDQRFDNSLSTALLVLAILGAFRAPTRERWLWGGVFGLFFVLSLGPTLQWPGLTDPDRPLRLPLYHLDLLLPFLSRVHFPARFLAVAHIGLVALAAHGVALLFRLPWRRAAVSTLLVLIGAGVAAQQLVGQPPPPVVDAPGAPSPATAIMQEDSGAFAVIDLPPFHLRSPDLAARYLQRCIHGHPALDAMGEAFLVPEPLARLQRENPLLDGIRTILDPEAEGAGAGRVVDQRDLAVLHAIGFRYVVVDTSVISDEALGEIEALLTPWLGPPRLLQGERLYTLRGPDGRPATITSLAHSREALQAYLANREAE